MDERKWKETKLLTICAKVLESNKNKATMINAFVSILSVC